MNEKELNQLINKMRVQLIHDPKLNAGGPDAIDEAILDIFYEAFTKGVMSRRDLEVVTNYMGYELDDDFKSDPTLDPIELRGRE